MDPRPSLVYLAPGASGVASSYRMPAARERPAPDDHVVGPETREELVRGERVFALPALPAHGDGHSKLDAVISHHLVPGYVPSIDLLTRFDEGNGQLEASFTADLDGYPALGEASAELRRLNPGVRVSFLNYEELGS